MGLDMYLRKKTYVKNWDHMKPEQLTQVTVIRAGKPIAHINPKRIEYVIEGMAYWRKANHIHKWFVDHCGGGERDQDVSVSASDLRNLLAACKEVMKASKLIKGKVVNGYRYKDGKEIPNMEDGKLIKDPAKAIELLPTESGFFFGSTEYDEYYIEDLKLTIDQLEAILSEEGADQQDYIYDSSY